MLSRKKHKMWTRYSNFFVCLIFSHTYHFEKDVYLFYSLRLSTFLVETKKIN